MNAHGEAIDADTDLVLNAHKIGVEVERARVLQHIDSIRARWSTDSASSLVTVLDELRAKVASGAHQK